MRRQTSLDIANTMMSYEVSKLCAVKHLMDKEDIKSDLEAIKRTYIAKSGWESIYISEVKKQGLGEYLPIPEIAEQVKREKKIIFKEAKFAEREAEVLEEDLLEM